MDHYIIDTVEFKVTQLDLFIRLLVACGIGLLLGLEREHSALVKKEHVFAGIRTFVLLALTGFTGAALHFLLSPWIFVMIMLAVMILTGISYWITSSKGDIGSTSELAALLTMLLGALTFVGYIEISLMITVIVLVILSSKMQLMNMIGRITQEEIYALVRFVVVALLIFPFLPNENYGPYEVINPREIGWVIILTSGIGFLGYLLMRILGANKGILLTGIVGGLVSSTMVTWVFSKKSKEEHALNSLYTSAILAACTIMVVRVFLWVFLFNKTLLIGLILPLSILFLTAAGATVYFYVLNKKDNKSETNLPLGKPLEMTNAILFGVLYVAILLVISFANEYLGNQGIFITSAIAGASDVDAISISISKMSVSTISVTTAQNAILIATLSNTIAKFAIALWASSKEMRKNILIGYGLIFAAAAVAFVVVNL
ncbi:MAG: MgtC/SapB family protein [Saprospiraceae bacterium]|nr:MgtC/SapB family protein [Saprospiraceae bacterium]